MSLSFHIDVERQIMTFTFSGPTCSVDELVEDYQRLLSSPSFKTGMNAVWDLSRLRLAKIPVNEIRRLPAALKPFMERRGTDFRVALVTTRQGDYRLLQIYLTLLKLIGPLHYRLFSSLPDAYGWIAKETVMADSP